MLLVEVGVVLYVVYLGHVVHDGTVHLHEVVFKVVSFLLVLQAQLLFGAEETLG